LAAHKSRGNIFILTDEYFGPMRSTWEAGGADMKVMIRFLRRLVRDVAGGPATEYALLLALVAAVAGFGMIALGDSLSQF